MLRTGHDWFDRAIEGCTDAIIQQVQAGEAYVRICYAEALVNELLLSETIIPELRRAIEENKTISQLFPMTELSESTEEERIEAVSKLFAGYLLIFAGGRIFGYCIAQFPGRHPEESSNEVSIKGPRDGFVEEMAVNVGLIRKRVRTADFKVERYTLGSVTRSEVALLYVSTLTNPAWVEEARRRLANVHTEAINGAMQMEEMLADRSVALFPLIDYAGRPDSAVDALLTGRVLFMLEGSPLVFLAPVNLLGLMRSPEDNYLPYYFVTLEKLLRTLSLIIAIFLPGFWVSLSAFNIDQIPFPLLATVVISRVGLPLSATAEMLIMLAMFELFREAGVRLPRAVGQTVAVVGGIIVGDAAIRAGLSSSTMLVVSALTAVSSFTLVNQSLSGAVTLVRLFVLVLSMSFGMFGFFVSMLAVLMYLASLRSFGVPYLAPLAPISPKQLIRTFLRLPTTFKGSPYSPQPARSRKKD